MIDMLIILCCSYIHDFISNSNDGHDDYDNAGGDQGHSHDGYNDYFGIRMMIILVGSHDDYDDAGGDQGHSHDNDLLWEWWCIFRILLN